MRAALLLACLLTAACGAGSRSGQTAVPAHGDATAQASPEAVVQLQLEAYNAGDLDAFAATYAPDIRIYDHPDRLLMSGIDQLRERYGALFDAAPELHASIDRRIVRGMFVIDHETVTGRPDGGMIEAVAIYEVRSGRIQNVWFIR